MSEARSCHAVLGEKDERAFGAFQVGVRWEKDFRDRTSSSIRLLAEGLITAVRWALAEGAHPETLTLDFSHVGRTTP